VKKGEEKNGNFENLTWMGWFYIKLGIGRLVQVFGLISLMNYSDFFYSTILYGNSNNNLGAT